MPERRLNDYKEHVRTIDPEIGKDIDVVENIAYIISAMVEQRTSLLVLARENLLLCVVFRNHPFHELNLARQHRISERCLIFFNISVYNLQ